MDFLPAADAAQPSVYFTSVTRHMAFAISAPQPSGTSALVETFLASSQEGRARLVSELAFAWAQGSFVQPSVKALLECSSRSPVRLAQIDSTVCRTLLPLLLHQTPVGSSPVGAAIAATQFLTIHPEGTALLSSLGHQLRVVDRSSATAVEAVHGAIALLARQQARDAEDGVSVAAALLKTRIDDFLTLPPGSSSRQQQALFDDLDRLKALLPFSPYFEPCTAAFAHPMLQPQPAS